jgi:superfamily II DNA or RNA helicase
MESLTDMVAPTLPAGGRWRMPDLPLEHLRALTAWRDAGRRGTIVVAEQSMSSQIAIAAMASEQRPTLCLVATRLRFEQWCGELQQFYRDRIGCYGSGVKRLRRVTVATYASADRYMERFGDRFELLIADEVHRVAAGDHEDGLRACRAVARLGLTVTAPQQPGAIARLVARIGPVVAARSGPDRIASVG